MSEESKTSEPSGPSGIGRFVRRVRMLLILIAMGCVAVVVLQNTESVETQLLFATVTMPLAALLFGTMLVGFVCGLFASLRFRK